MTLLCCFTVPYIRAQSTEINVQPIEGGAQIFYAVPTGGNFGADPNGTSIGFQTEIRYNFPKSKFDAGLFVQLGVFMRDDTRFSLEGTPYTIDSAFRVWTFGVTSHFNFRQGRNVNPFIGIGLGITRHSCDNPQISEASSIAFIPEVGVELLHHLHVAVRYNLNKRSYNQFQFSVGFTIGGRPKKTKPLD